MPPSDHEDGRVDRDLLRLQRLVGDHPADGSPGEVLGLLSRGDVIRVHPRDVLADVHHLEVEGIQPALCHGVAEGVLVKEGRAGRHHDPVELVVPNVLLDQLLPGIGAHVLIIARDDDAVQRGDILRQGLHVHRARDVRAAVAHVEADAWCPVGGRRVRHGPLSLLPGPPEPGRAGRTGAAGQARYPTSRTPGR